MATEVYLSVNWKGPREVRVSIPQAVERIGERVISGDNATCYRAQDRQARWHSVVAIDNMLPSRMVDSGVVNVFVIADSEYDRR
ncbi:hypothetical protein ACFYP4_02380 [Streptomyces sp. NPDC005551]|uniref:hypothetical protein n=1 Tax=Streptomyces sp. NPDC005551 TaxID=3364725 RepID=UPI0036CE13C5